MRPFSLLAAGAAIVRAQQIPLTTFDYEAEYDPHDAYEFEWPIHKVAIVGAGVGGLIAYREFTQNGFDVHLFERDDVPGGNWHYTEDAPRDAQVPNGDPVDGDYVLWIPPHIPYEEQYDDSGETGLQRYLTRWRDHRAPTPLWASLHSNAPAPIQQIRELPWPAGTPWELPQEQLQRYLRAFASLHGVNSNDENPDVSYNTRVEHIEKSYGEDGKRHGWTLTLKTFVKTGNATSKATWWTKDFDAVVIATGRYNAPNVPNILGLDAWARHFPGHFIHSRQYRRPNRFINQTVLVIGASTSGTEIARDISPYTTAVIESIRPDRNERLHFPLDRFKARIPQNATIVGEIKQIHVESDDIRTAQVELVNGTILTGIDHIISATGFRYTYPFLSQYHNASLGNNETAAEGVPQPLVTDGTHVRSLYLDMVYIEEPTLGFLNVNVGMQSFTYAEFVSLALAKVWSGRAKLPSTSEQWHRHRKTVEERGGYGQHYLFLGGDRTKEIVRYFTAWLNSASWKYGGRQIDGLPSEDLQRIQSIWAKAHFGFALDPSDDEEENAPNNLMADGIEDLLVNSFW